MTSFDYATTAQTRAAEEYLRKKFGVVFMDALDPYLLLVCEQMPRLAPRPHLVGGCIAIWKPRSEGNWVPFPGEEGGAMEEDEYPIDEELIKGFECNTIPEDEDLVRLGMSLVPDCMGVAWVDNWVVIELPRATTQEFIRRLRTLPMHYEHAPFAVLYSNGPMPDHQCAARTRKPRPERAPDKRTEDDTDYVVVQNGEFYPGTMISTDEDTSNPEEKIWATSATAGVLLQRAGEQRLTCSWHLWEKLAARNKDVVLGDGSDTSKEVFQVFQGDTLSPVGTVVSRIGSTDIAMAQLHPDVTFRNKFVGSEVEPRRILHHGNLNYRDQVMIDSLATGKVRLSLVGSRVEPVREPGVAHVRLHQGIYATDSITMDESPHIRESACGAVLVRYREINAKTGQWTPVKDTLARGEICGMMHFADITERRASVTGYFIYADSFAPLIEEGWKVVPLDGGDAEDNIPEKKKSVPGESPSKRPRRGCRGPE
ncbi:hypothetical protein B0T16DRAFT_319277 [Cercophora newfieldiana]|uniref:Uncharacterized protein n=1 Tax=Cercophora newfieldiana TaxID=92897 RepID=A0AA39YMP6_9PEZI|nr:hypothetical protein B0T16DRAFT_319277 [Cercophora newfieldiana]